jgi:hypothetical protein
MKDGGRVPDASAHLLSRALLRQSASVVFENLRVQSDNQQTGSRLLWDSDVHCRVHKSPQTISVVRQISPINTFPKNLPNIILPTTSGSSAWVCSLHDFQSKFCTNFSSSPCALHVPPISSSFTVHTYNIWWTAKITKLIITHFSSALLLFHPSYVKLLLLSLRSSSFHRFYYFPTTSPTDQQYSTQAARYQGLQVTQNVCSSSHIQ